MTYGQKALHEIKEKYGYTQLQLGDALDTSQTNVSNFLKGKVLISDPIARKMSEKFGYDYNKIKLDSDLHLFDAQKHIKAPEKNTKALHQLEKYQNGIPKNSKNIVEESREIYQPEPQKFSEKTYKKEVTVIPAKAQLGLQSFLYPEEMMNELETKIILVDQDYKGKYYEIECVGDSMDDGSYQGIKSGDSVLCREISKLHWKNKFHRNDWEFVFFHNEHGIIIKSIKDQNLENGDLILKSYNTDKDEYPDFTINIKDCYAICNVVQVTQNRKKYFTL